MILYTRYTHPAWPGTGGFEDSAARQESKDECDINRIMARYLKTGQFPPGVGVGLFGDFSEVTDFQSAQETMMRAGEQFAGLPAKVRDRFQNNPAAFLAYVHSDKLDMKECLEWGILTEEAAKRVAESMKPAAPAPAAAPASAAAAAPVKT